MPQKYVQKHEGFDPMASKQEILYYTKCEQDNKVFAIFGVARDIIRWEYLVET